MYTANVPHEFFVVLLANLQLSAFAARTRPTLAARNAFQGAIDAPSFTCLFASLAPMPVLESKLPLTMRFSPHAVATQSETAVVAATAISFLILMYNLLEWYSARAHTHRPTTPTAQPTPSRRWNAAMIPYLSAARKDLNTAGNTILSWHIPHSI